MRLELCNTVMLPMTWVTSRRITQSSKPVPRYSNWLQNWCPMGRSQRSLSLTCITHTRNQTTLGLAVKLQHRHGSSELIRLLHDHGFIVSYDEVIRLRKSAAKFVGDSDRNNILHQAMGLSWRVWPIFDHTQRHPCHGSRVRAAPIMHPRNWKCSTWINEPCDPMPTAVCFTISQTQPQQVYSSSALHWA